VQILEELVRWEGESCFESLGRLAASNLPFVSSPLHDGRRKP
jgi:hypothetical protein